MANPKSQSPYMDIVESARTSTDIQRQHRRNQDAVNADAQSDQSSQSEYNETDDGSTESEEDLIEEHSVSLDASDFGVSDIAKYIQENPDGWNNTPDPTDWYAIRNTGTAKKEWPKDMAIEAAFRDFKGASAPVDVEKRQILKDTPLTQLLRGTIVFITEHYNNLKKKETVAKKKSSNKSGKKARADTYTGDSSLIRTTKNACQKACNAYFAPTGTIGAMNTPWDQHLPPPAKILACAFVAKDGTINGTVAGCLAQVKRLHLLQFVSDGKEASQAAATSSTATDGQAYNMAITATDSAVAARQLAVQALELAKENAEKIEKPTHADRLIVGRIKSMEENLNQFKEDSNVQHEELNKIIDDHASQLQKHQVKPELEDGQVDAKAIKAEAIDFNHFSHATINGIRSMINDAVQSKIGSNTTNAKPQPKTLVKLPGSRVSEPGARVSTPLNSRTAVPLKRSAASDAVESTSKKNKTATEQSDFDSFFS